MSVARPSSMQPGSEDGPRTSATTTNNLGQSFAHTLCESAETAKLELRRLRVCPFFPHTSLSHMPCRHSMRHAPCALHGQALTVAHRPAPVADAANIRQSMFALGPASKLACTRCTYLWVRLDVVLRNTRKVAYREPKLI